MDTRVHAAFSSRLPSGNLSGLVVQNPRPWEISWASGSVFSNTSLLSAVYGYILDQQSYVLKPVSEEQFEMSFQLRIVLDQVTNSKVTTGEDGIINLVTMRPTFIKTTPPSKLSF